MHIWFNPRGVVPNNPTWMTTYPTPDSSRPRTAVVLLFQQVFPPIFSKPVHTTNVLPHIKCDASGKWHIDTLYFSCHHLAVNKHKIPHSIRFAADTRNALANIKTDLPISVSSLTNHILREYGIPAYLRDKRHRQPNELRPYTRRKEA